MSYPVRVKALSARLRHPVGINRTYRMGSGNFYKSKPAKSWFDDAILSLRVAGFKRLPAGDYEISVDSTLATKRHDIDAGIKATLDIIAKALDVDDECITYVALRKRTVATTAEQYLRVAVIIDRIEEGAA